MSLRVFICIDMEGVAGIATLDQIIRGGSGYARAQQLMTAEANAAIRGAFDGGATEVVVADSHGTMDNLLHGELDPRARLVFGSPRPSCMVQGITREDAVALFVGQHTEAGAAGVLSHTFSSNFTELRVNGVPMSESEVNGLFAAELGVPVGLVTGDDLICATASKAFVGVRTVETKRAIGWATAESRSPSYACEDIQAAAAEVVRGCGSLTVPSVPGELVLEVDFAHALGADLAASIGGIERLGARTLRRVVPDADGLLGTIAAFYQLAALAAQQVSAIALRR